MTTKQLNVSFNVIAQLRPDAETGTFVTYCAALDLYSAGKTRPEARKAMQSAVDLYVRVCFQRGILGKVLLSKGFVPDHHGKVAPDAEYIVVSDAAPERPSGDYDDSFEVVVPMELVAQAGNGDMSGCQP